MPAYRDATGRWRYRKWTRTPEGKRVRITGTPATNTKHAAEAAERNHLARIENPALFQAPPPPQEKEPVPTVRQYAKLFTKYLGSTHIDRAAVEQILKANILPRFGSMRLDEIRQIDIDKYRVSSKLAPKTIANHLSVLSRLLKYAARNKVIEPVGLNFAVKAQLPRVQSVHRQDFETLFAATDDIRLQAAMLLAFEAGLRIGEVRALQWGDIDELNRELIIERAFDTRGNLKGTKSYRARTVPVTPRLWTALEKLPRKSPWVITKLVGGSPLQYWGIRDALVALYDATGVTRPRAPWHALRASFCTQLAEAGVPPHVIQALAGHTSFETTLRYVDTRRDAKHQAIAKAFGQNLGKGPGAETRKSRKPE